MQLEGRWRRIPAALFVQVGEGQQQQADVYDHGVGFRTHLLHTKQRKERNAEVFFYVSPCQWNEGIWREPDVY